MKPKTLSEIIAEVMGDYDGPVKAAKIIRDVRSVADTSETTIRGELSKMKDRGLVVQPRYGSYELSSVSEAETGGADTGRGEAVTDLLVGSKFNLVLKVGSATIKIPCVVAGPGEIAGDIAIGASEPELEKASV